MAPRYLTAVFIALLVGSIGLSACGEETETPATTQVPTQTEAAGLDLATFSSDRKGYRIDHPENWTVQEDAFSFGELAADAFVAPLPDDDFTANVNVLCEPVPPGTVTDDYLDANIDTLNTSLQVDPVIGETDQALGQTIRLVTYDSVLGSRNVEITQVAVVSGECGWVLTLTNVPGLREKYLPVFRAMYHSFRSE